MATDKLRGTWKMTDVTPLSEHIVTIEKPGRKPLTMNYSDDMDREAVVDRATLQTLRVDVAECDGKDIPALQLELDQHVALLQFKNKQRTMAAAANESE